MDYRGRNKIPPKWPGADFDRQMQVQIYQQADSLGMFQLDAPDHSTGFLTCFAFCSEDLSQSQFYAIEAPRGCPMRQAFEIGKISWMEFWSHKGWLLRLDVPGHSGDVASNYITMDDLDDLTIQYFKYYGHEGPLLLMAAQLKARIDIAKFEGKDAMEEERDYRQFMAINGHRLPDVTAGEASRNTPRVSA
jgi:hypothetical protein